MKKAIPRARQRGSYLEITATIHDKKMVVYPSGIASGSNILKHWPDDIPDFWETLLTWLAKEVRMLHRTNELRVAIIVKRDEFRSPPYRLTNHTLIHLMVLGQECRLPSGSARRGKSLVLSSDFGAKCFGVLGQSETSLSL